MFKNYFKVAIRNILKYKMFSFINIFGLAVAMTVCMLIILMLADQKSYDQFHEKKDKIYRILSQKEDVPIPIATTPFPLASTLKTDYPIIEEVTQLVLGIGGDGSYNEKTLEMRGFFAEPSFFKLFSYELEKGDRNTALINPNSMVITSEFAQLFFNNENPIGKTVDFTNRGLFIYDLDFVTISSPPVAWGSYKITGVMADKNQKSHLKFDVLISSSSLPVLYEDDKIKNSTENWKSVSKAYTYVILKPGNDNKNLTASLADLVARKYAGIENMQGFRLIGQKLTEITPGRFVGNAASIKLPIEAYYFLSFLALIVLLLACLNYINLSIARSLTRAKEIGVRKVSGAKRKNLVFQFLNESILTTLLALVMAVNLLVVVKSAFMNLWLNRYLNFELQESFSIYLVFTGFAVFIGILAGVFPALNLSKYQPVKVLKNIESVRPGKLGLRKILSVSQLVVSLFFIVTSILMYNQIQHFFAFEYGFTSENIVNIELQGNDYRILSNELSSVPGVSTISASEYLPATGVSHSKGLKKTDSEEFTEVAILAADENFIDNLELNIVAGRNLPATAESSEHFILVNETAAKKFGYEEASQIVGQVFLMESAEEPVEVIGVIEDFYFQSAMIADEIGPFMLLNQPDEFIYANLKIVSSDLKGVIANLEGKWNSMDPVHPFKYHFFDEQVAVLNQALGDLLSILGFIAFLAVTIACLGLLGMAMYNTERRRKEIGIRKVLGAAEATIVLLLSKDFLKILLISIFIAAPLSYFINNAWLQNFPNRVEFGFGTVFLGSVILLMLGLITIGSQTLRAAGSNPVDSLRME